MQAVFSVFRYLGSSPRVKTQRIKACAVFRGMGRTLRVRVMGQQFSLESLEITIGKYLFQEYIVS